MMVGFVEIGEGEDKGRGKGKGEGVAFKKG
jgi:hypothetical protein